MHPSVRIRVESEYILNRVPDCARMCVEKDHSVGYRHTAAYIVLCLIWLEGKNHESETAISRSLLSR